MGQMIAALLILGTLKATGKVEFPDFSKDIPKRVFPLPILYLCNMVSGLMSTQVNHLNYAAEFMRHILRLILYDSYSMGLSM